MATRKPGLAVRGDANQADSFAACVRAALVELEGGRGSQDVDLYRYQLKESFRHLARLRSEAGALAQPTAMVRETP